MMTATKLMSLPKDKMLKKARDLFARHRSEGRNPLGGEADDVPVLDFVRGEVVASEGRFHVVHHRGAVTAVGRAGHHPWAVTIIPRG